MKVDTCTQQGLDKDLSILRVVCFGNNCQMSDCNNTKIKQKKTNKLTRKKKSTHFLSESGW